MRCPDTSSRVCRLFAGNVCSFNQHDRPVDVGVIASLQLSREIALRSPAWLHSAGWAASKCLAFARLHRFFSPSLDGPLDNTESGVNIRRRPRASRTYHLAHLSRAERPLITITDPAALNGQTDPHSTWARISVFQLQGTRTLLVCARTIA